MTGKSYPVKPVVVFPGWYIKQIGSNTFKEIWVLNPKGLPKFIAQESEVIAPEDVLLAMNRLEVHVRGFNGLGVGSGRTAGLRPYPSHDMRFKFLSGGEYILSYIVCSSLVLSLSEPSRSFIISQECDLARYTCQNDYLLATASFLWMVVVDFAEYR